ncbi:hypothetical protein [Nostoc sp. ATCC 53789]|uniref:hypothetical protein n=1 Tax=Nostoc sp. ATCC 53789 TaxID=76335 RepID=UPI000DEC0740|nr:hypothetical protein [Nostoc sp. ATCC 53789]QHG21302.1 hypothetical protein GJB62_36295 [Nostoc sp. ATCC 53789]RCJ16202.1 hypothetical protein A6V25_31620 [Nostoc sp. ATCC 53789]
MGETRNRNSVQVNEEGQQKLKNAKSTKHNSKGRLWTYPDIAITAGVHERTVKRLFYGQKVDWEYASAIAQALNLELTDLIDVKPTTPDHLTKPTSVVLSEKPRPPQLYTNSPYLASHRFVGREDNLYTLDEWAQQSDPHSAFLFEAIGGSGKSILTWTWLQNRSDKISVDWAGRFWYSFYERGAETRDFLIQVLSYMTEQPYQKLEEKAVGELVEQLLRQLRAKPWLLILDGIERLLVHYHRFDAAYADDDTAGTEDKISQRDPLAMVRDEDSDLFRSFLTAAPSKILITSRLTPRCLVNSSHQPLPGLHHQRLPGLRPKDAEALFRSCGVYGDSQAVRSYLKESCDCHPLVIGFLAGLVKRYLPDRGNFDAWLKSPNGGLALNLAELNLVQRRNHILEAAVNALSDNSRELLATVAMVSSGFDYRVLVALSPPLALEISATLNEPDTEANSPPTMNDLQRQVNRRHNQSNIAVSHQNGATPDSIASRHQAQFNLQATVTDLEERGLLLFDKQRSLYDLHPVVRSVVVGGLGIVERERFGGRIIDYFSAAAARPINEAETLEDVQSALNVVHTYLAMGKLEDAWKFFDSGLGEALWLNLEAYDKIIAILRPFFADNWINLNGGLSAQYASHALNWAGVTLASLDLHQEAICSYIAAIKINLENNNWQSVLTNLTNIGVSAIDIERLALANRILSVCITLSEVTCDDELFFLSHLTSMYLANIVGNQHMSEEHWHKLDPLGRDWSLARYRPGEAEAERLRYQFYYDCLIEADLQAAEHIAASSRASRHVRRKFHRLRGEWLLKEKQYVLAATSLEHAAQMAREVGLRDAVAETQLALAKYREGTLKYPQEEAEQLSAEKERSELHLALLWEAIGDEVRSLDHARKAFEKACADGEPYVCRQYLDVACELIKRLSGEAPKCKLHDPSHDSRILCPHTVDFDSLLKEIESMVEQLRVKNKNAIERHRNRSSEERRIANKGHLIHKLKAKDSTGRWAYYFILVEPSQEKEFLSALDSNADTDLNYYGEVIASNYGEEPSNEVKKLLREKYGFSV